MLLVNVKGGCVWKKEEKKRKEGGGRLTQENGEKFLIGGMNFLQTTSDWLRKTQGRNKKTGKN